MSITKKERLERLRRAAVKAGRQGWPYAEYENRIMGKAGNFALKHKILLKKLECVVYEGWKEGWKGEKR